MKLSLSWTRASEAAWKPCSNFCWVRFKSEIKCYHLNLWSMTANLHIFTNSLLARFYKFISCKLHNSLFVSVPRGKLRECCWTAVQCIAKFCVLPANYRLYSQIFFSWTKLWRKIGLCSSKLSHDMPWNFMQTFIEKSLEQRAKSVHFACITFAQYCMLSALFLFRSLF